MKNFQPEALSSDTVTARLHQVCKQLVLELLSEEKLKERKETKRKIPTAAVAPLPASISDRLRKQRSNNDTEGDLDIIKINKK